MSTASNNPSVSTNRWRWRPLIFLPPSYPRSGPPISVVLTDWISIHTALGGRLAPRCPAGAFAQGLDHLGPGPVVAPLRKVVIDCALGQQIMRQPVPVAPAPVQIKKRVEDFPHVDRTRVPAAWALLGRWDQRFPAGPLFVRELRGVFLSRLVFFRHKSARLCGWDMR